MGHFKFKLYQVFAALFFLSAGVNGFAQEQSNFQKISGIGGNFHKPYQISQDTIGNLWITSGDRVIKYNSVKDISYSASKGLPSEVKEVSSVFTDSKGKIWIGTNAGLCLYNLLKNQFELIASNKVVNRIGEDQKGNLWFSDNEGIWKINSETSADKPAPKLISSLEGVNTLFFEKNNLFLGTTHGLYQLQNGNTAQKIVMSGYRDFNVQSLLFTGNSFLIGTLENGLFKAKPDFSIVEKIYNLPYEVLKFPVTDLALTSDHQIYLATKGGGILYLNKDFNLAKQFSHQPNLDTSLGSDVVYNFYRGQANTLWLATNSGVEFLNLKTNNFKFLAHEQGKYSSLGNNFVTAAAKDSNGKIWFGTKNGLSIWDPQNDTWQHIISLSYRHPSTTPDIVKDIAANGEHVWVATYNDGVYKININTFLRAQYAPDLRPVIGVLKATSIYIDHHKNIWIGGDGGELSEIKPGNVVQNYHIENVRKITGTSNGNIFAVTENSVFKIDAASASVKEIPELSANQLHYTSINAVKVLNDGNLALASQGAGLIIYDVQQEKVKVLNKNSGLASENIEAVFSVSQNEFWATTSGGIANIKLKEDDTLINMYGTAQGLKTLDFNPDSYSELGNSDFVLGTSQGIQIINPEVLKEQVEQPPHLVFENIKAGNKNFDGINKINPLKPLHLETGQNSFTVNVLGVAPRNPAEVEYSWKLDGLDKSWAPPVRENRIQYAGLEPGNYTLLVRTRFNNGDWGAARKLQFMVASPWWANYWMYGLFAVISLALILIAVYLIKNAGKRNKEKAKPTVPNTFAYEIKTPLHLLMASLNRLILEEDAENKQKLKNTLAKINALFEPVINIDSPVKRFSGANISKIDLEVFIYELIEDFAPLLLDKNLEIIANNQWEKEAFYYNLDNLSRILINIISSSMQYCDKDGKIIINLFETNKGDLKIQISDNGKGIPQEQQKVIRQYFSKGKLSAELQKNDILTLLLVRDIVKRGGGSIVFESVLNEGTTFSLILKNRNKEYSPNEKEESISNPVAVEEKPVVPPKEFSESKVLVVEPNSEIRRVLFESIGKKCQVFEAQDASEAYKNALDVSPDIIITEKDLPGEDGFSLCENIREDINLNHIPVFMMVPSLQEVNYINKKEKGIVEFIEKPINVNQVLAQISVTLKAHRELRSRYVNSSHADEEIVFRNEKDERFIGELKKIIFQHLHESSFGVYELSAAMQMNSNSLYMKLKNIVNLAPQDFIIHTKLSYARRLLVKGEVNVNEVATRAGFANAETFLTAFKKFYGYSPGGVLEGK